MIAKKPTEETYGALSQAYVFFNQRLFQSRLPECLITLQRNGSRTLGFYAPGRFVNKHDSRSDELAMNPLHFASRDVVDVLGTLVHEMTHVEQQYFGKPSRSGYHNKAWGQLMQRVGLYPSNTGAPGGKETGQQMTHYVMEGGPFAVASADLVRCGFKLDWAEVQPIHSSLEDDGTNTDGVDVGPVDRSNRVRFTCPGCLAKAWGKRSLAVVCGHCNKALQPD